MEIKTIFLHHNEENSKCNKISRAIESLKYYISF